MANKEFKVSTASVEMLAQLVRTVSVVKRATQVPRDHRANKALQDKLLLSTTKVNKALKAHRDHVVRKAIKATQESVASRDYRA
jgi:hypothetical protein